MTSTDRNRNRAHRLQLHRLKEHRPAACAPSGFETRWAPGADIISAGRTKRRSAKRRSAKMASGHRRSTT